MCESPTESAQATTHGHARASAPGIPGVHQVLGSGSCAWGGLTPLDRCPARERGERGPTVRRSRAHVCPRTEPCHGRSSGMEGKPGIRTRRPGDRARGDTRRLVARMPLRLKRGLGGVGSLPTDSGGLGSSEATGECPSWPPLTSSASS